MDIRCDKCDTNYELDDARVTETGVNVKCTHCGHVFVVKRRPTSVTREFAGVRVRSGSQSSQSPRSGESSPSRDSGGRDRAWQLRLRHTQEVLRFRDLDVLRQWIHEQRVTREDDISRGGTVWRRLGSVSELEAFFHSDDEAELARLRTAQAIQSGNTGRIFAPLPPPGGGGVPLAHEPPRLRTATPGLGVGPGLLHDSDGSRRIHLATGGAGIQRLRLEEGAPQGALRMSSTGRTLRPPLLREGLASAMTPRESRSPAQAAALLTKSPPPSAASEGALLRPPLSAISSDAAEWLAAAGLVDLPADLGPEEPGVAPVPEVVQEAVSVPVPSVIADRPSGAIPRHIVQSPVRPDPRRHVLHLSGDQAAQIPAVLTFSTAPELKVPQAAVASASAAPPPAVGQAAVASASTATDLQASAPAGARILQRRWAAASQYGGPTGGGDSAASPGPVDGQVQEIKPFGQATSAWFQDQLFGPGPEAGLVQNGAARARQSLSPAKRDGAAPRPASRAPKRRGPSAEISGMSRPPVPHIGPGHTLLLVSAALGVAVAVFGLVYYVTLLSLHRSGAALVGSVKAVAGVHVAPMTPPAAPGTLPVPTSQVVQVPAVQFQAPVLVPGVAQLSSPATQVASPPIPGEAKASVPPLWQPDEAPRPDWKVQLRQARRLLDDGKQHEARRLYEQLLDGHRNSPEVHVGLGECDLELERYQAAVEQFQEALTIRSVEPGALIGLADTYRRRGDLEQAVRWYRAYLDRHPHGVQADRARNNLERLVPQDKDEPEGKDDKEDQADKGGNKVDQADKGGNKVDQADKGGNKVDSASKGGKDDSPDGGAAPSAQ